MRRRKKYDLYFVITLSLLSIGYFVYSHMSAESRGVENYAAALEDYKKRSDENE